MLYNLGSQKNVPPPPPPPPLPPPPPPPSSKQWWDSIGVAIGFLFFFFSRLWSSIHPFVFKNISESYADVVAVLLLLSIAVPLRFSVYISRGILGLFFLALIGIFFAPISAIHVEEELGRHSVGNNFTEFSASLFNKTHSMYGYFGRSGTGKTNVAERASDLGITMLNRDVHKRVFFLHDHESKKIEHLFNSNNPNSLAGWVELGGAGCSKEECHLILEDLHLLLDYYYVTLKNSSLVDEFFSNLEALVGKKGRRVVVFMIIEITAFSRSIDQSTVANVASNAELQNELAKSNSTFSRMGDHYLPVFFKDVHHNYNQWKKAMQLHLDELVRNTISTSKATRQPFDSNTKVKFDESVFAKSRKLVAAFKDVKKFILPRIYSKLVDEGTPRDCTPANGRILTVYANDDFDVKCERCISCSVLYSNWVPQFFKTLFGIPLDFILRVIDVLRRLPV